MNKYVLLFYLGVYFCDCIFSFSLNTAGLNGDGDPALSRSPGPPVSNENYSLRNISTKCRLNGIVKKLEEKFVNLTVTHKLFKTDVLVSGLMYVVNLGTQEETSIDFSISSSIDGVLSGVFSNSQDCGPHILIGRLTSHIHSLNWMFHINKGISKASNVSFRLEYSFIGEPFVYALIYSLPITQKCELQLSRDESVITNHDLPHFADCQVWFPVQKPGEYGLVIELTRLNVPCSRGFVHFSGLNTTHNENTIVHLKSHKQMQLCGKLEELPEADRYIYFPVATSQTQTRPTMHVQGEPVFSIFYHLVDYCYNISFLTRNGSFDLKPERELQCSFRIHLPYGNRVALKLWVGDSETSEASERTTINFQDLRNGHGNCDGLLTQIQDGSSFWEYCTKPGDAQRHIEIISKENQLILKVRIRPSTGAAALGLKFAYRAEPVQSIVGMCDYGWVMLRQFCIGVIEGVKLPWAQAEIECVRKGGHLVSIRSNSDHNIVDNLLINSPGYLEHNAYWIGASDKTHESDFKWSDQSPFSYANWFPGWAQHNNYNKQPNDDGLSNQDCVEVRRIYPLLASSAQLTTTFMWNDRDCSISNYFICERLQNNEPLEGSWLPSCNKSIVLSRDQPRASVSSPGFPRQYPDNVKCEIDISALPGYRIILDFEELELEKETSCSYDYLQIIEPTVNHSSSTSNNESAPGRRLCGDWSSKLKLLRYVSYSSKLKLRFISDYSHHFGGFKTRVSMENAYQCADDRFYIFNNSCYLIVSYPKVTWNTSQQICKGMKSTLASILSSEEERFITSSIRREPDYRTSAIYWLGALSNRLTNFSWIDGSPMIYQSWRPGLEPSDNDLLRHAEEVTCLSLQWMPSGVTLQSGLYWKVHRCEAVGGYVCKRNHEVKAVGTDYNRTINGTEGSLTSPNYPNNYFHNLDFTIRITGPEKTRIIIKFIHVHIESQLECLYDFIELKSIYKKERTAVNDAVKLCGNHERDMDRFNFVSETNEVQINFHSDYSISDKGFSLIWYTVDVSACPMQTLTAKEGTFITPNYPEFLLAHLDCTVAIIAPSGKRIWLEFLPEANGLLNVKEAKDFYVDVMLGKHTVSNRLFETEGLITEGSFVSFDEKLKLKIHTGDHPVGPGFRAVYRITKAVNGDKIVSLGNCTSGALYHLNYPDNPPSHVDFVQNFIAPLGSIILLELYNMKLADLDCPDTSFIEILDNYSDPNGTTWKLCYSKEIEDSFTTSAPIYISSYLNTLHLRQFHGANGIPLNGTLKVQFDNSFKSKLKNYKENNVESCFPNPCQNGGKCIVKNSTKFCECIGYYTGLFCVLTKCELDPCVFGTCELTYPTYKCHCMAGYVGFTCDKKARPCEGNPCEGRGVCTEKGDTFQCQCHAWWEGQRCEKRMLHIPYKPLSERMLHEPFWLGLMTVFVVMGVIGLVWCAKRHFPEKLEKLLAEEDSRNRSTVSSLRSTSVREQLAAVSASGAVITPSQSSAPSSRSIFGRLGIRKPSILSLTSPHASGYETAAARTFSLDDLLKPPPRRTPSPKKKRNNSTPTKKSIADKRHILQQLVSPKPNSKKVSLGELIQLSELKPDDEIKSDTQTNANITVADSTAQTVLIDPKLEKKVTFARLLNKVSAEMGSGSEMELGIMQTNRLGCVFARPFSTPPSPCVDSRSPNSMSSNQGSDSFTSSDLAIPSALSTSISDLLIDRRQKKLQNGRQKPTSADSILAMFRNFSSSSAAVNFQSSLKLTPSTTPTASSPQDDVAGDDDSSTSSIHTPASFSSEALESPVMQRHTVEGTIEVPVFDSISAHKSATGGSNLLHAPTILLEIPSTINKCLSPIREMPTPLPSPTPSRALTPMMGRRSNACSSLEDAELSDDRVSVEIPNFSISTDIDEEYIHCPDIVIDLQAEDGLILEEAAALQHTLRKSRTRPPPIGQSQEKSKSAITITIDPPPLIIPTLTIQTPSPTIPKLHSQSFPGSPPPHRASLQNTSYFQFPSPKHSRKIFTDLEKPTSLDLPFAPPMITITCNMSETESDIESISPAIQSSSRLGNNSSGMTYLSPFSINPRGEHTASESNLSSSGYSSMASPGPSRCSSNNPLFPSEMDDQGPGGLHRRQSLTLVLKSKTTSSNSEQQIGADDERRGRSDSETLSDDPLAESNDEGIGTDHIDERIEEGELKSAKELEVFMINESDLLTSHIEVSLPSKCLPILESTDRLLSPMLLSSKNSLQLPSIVVQCDSPNSEKHLSPMSSRSESPLSDRTTGLGRFSPQFYGRNKDLLPFTDSDGLYDFPSSDKVNLSTCTHHKKSARKREKKLLRNCKTPSPTKTVNTSLSLLDLPNKDLHKVPPPRKLSPKRRIVRSQVVSSSSSSDSITSTTRDMKLCSSSPSPDVTRWSSPVVWLGEKYSKSKEQLTQDVPETESSPLAKSKVSYGSHQKFSRLRAISHQIRFLRRLEQSLKKRERTISPSESFDSDNESPRSTSPLLQSSKNFKVELRKSNSIGKLHRTNIDRRKGPRTADSSIRSEQSFKIVQTE